MPRPREPVIVDGQQVKFRIADQGEQQANLVREMILAGFSIHRIFHPIENTQGCLMHVTKGVVQWLRTALSKWSRRGARRQHHHTQCAIRNAMARNRRMVRPNGRPPESYSGERIAAGAEEQTIRRHVFRWS